MLRTCLYKRRTFPDINATSSGWRPARQVAIGVRSILETPAVSPLGTHACPGLGQGFEFSISTVPAKCQTSPLMFPYPKSLQGKMRDQRLQIRAFWPFSRLVSRTAHVRLDTHASVTVEVAPAQEPGIRIAWCLAWLSRIHTCTVEWSFERRQFGWFGLHWVGASYWQQLPKVLFARLYQLLRRLPLTRPASPRWPGSQAPILTQRVTSSIGDSLPTRAPTCSMLATLPGSR